MNKFYSINDARGALLKLNIILKGKSIAIKKQFEGKYFFIAKYDCGVYTPLTDNEVNQYLKD